MKNKRTKRPTAADRRTALNALIITTNDTPDCPAWLADLSSRGFGKTDSLSDTAEARVDEHANNGGCSSGSIGSLPVDPAGGLTRVPGHTPRPGVHKPRLIP